MIEEDNKHVPPKIVKARPRKNQTSEKAFWKGLQNHCHRDHSNTEFRPSRKDYPWK